MSYWLHIIEDFRQVTISISPPYLEEIERDYMNAMAFIFFFFKDTKLTMLFFSFMWQDLFFMKSCWLASLMIFNWQFFIDIVPNYLLCYFQLEWKLTQAYNSLEHCFLFFASSRITRGSPSPWNFPGLRSLKGIVVESEFF